MKTTALIFILLLSNCNKINKEKLEISDENSLKLEVPNNEIKLEVEFLNIFLSPPDCGILLHGGLYKAKVLDNSSLYGDHVLIYILCKEAYTFLNKRVTVYLDNNLRLKNGYAISDFSNSLEIDKLKMKKFVLMKVGNESE